MGKFDNKVVIITGSSAGIGQDAAFEFGKEGAKVVIHGQNEERLSNTEEQLKKLGVPSEHILKVIGSMENPETPKKIVDETIKKFGKIDVLINNAAVMSQQKFLADQDQIENLDFLYKVNLRSVIVLTQLAFPHLEKTKGNITNVSSIGATKPWAQSTYYCLLKAALDHFTRCYAQKYGPKGVRINVCSPGPIKTLFLERHGIPADHLEKATDAMIERTLLKRYGDVSETSGVLKFLASDDASYVTGATYVVDGGASLYGDIVDIN